MEYEAHFAEMAAGNLRHARSQGATGSGHVVHGDARNIATTLAEQAGTAALVLTSPPYGATTHGQVRTGRDNGGGKIDKFNSRYSTDRRNLAHRPTAELVAGFGQILTGCASLQAHGGVIAVTVRPFRVAGELVDLPGQVIATAEEQGLVLVDRFAALLCGLRDGRIITRALFFQMIEARRLREQGILALATAHEDLLLFGRDHETGRPVGETAGLDLHGRGVPSSPDRTGPARHRNHRRRRLMGGDAVTRPDEGTQGGGAELTLTWRLIPADPSAEEQLTRVQARAIKEVLTWWTEQAAQFPSKSSQQDREAADQEA
ncbi:hypothetical protein [Actinomadura nitritigenes]|uniref:hypothetical protein n=1 Tax=Actinomadura nitritigenes TaxID=134602 RepID=UPI003D9093E7